MRVRRQNRPRIPDGLCLRRMRLEEQAASHDSYASNHGACRHMAGEYMDMLPEAPGVFNEHRTSSRIGAETLAGSDRYGR